MKLCGPIEEDGETELIEGMTVWRKALCEINDVCPDFFYDVGEAGLETRDATDSLFNFHVTYPGKILGKAGDR